MSSPPPPHARSLAALLVVLFTLGAPSLGRADVIYVFGSTRVVDDPGDLFGTVDPPIAFFEREAGAGIMTTVNTVDALRLGDDVGGEVCDTELSTFVSASHFVYQNTTDTVNEDVLIFSGPVVGLSYERGCMEVSDSYYARPGTMYPSSGGMGLTASEGDVLHLFESRRTVFHRFRAPGTDWDGYRAITATPALDNPTDVKLECMPTELTVRAGDMVDIDLDIGNDGPGNANDTQVVFRVPRIATVLETGGEFSCTPDDEANVTVCTFNDGLLRSGEATDLRVRMRIDSAPPGVTRFVGFASGAVQDDNLGNNECDVRIFDRDTDGGVPGDGGMPVDGGYDGGDVGPDGSMRDSGGMVGGSPDGPAFRGGGGCACDATGSRGQTDFAFIGLALVLVFRGRRWRDS